jgi:plasmid maintenance system antidote protein VapI
MSAVADAVVTVGDMTYAHLTAEQPTHDPVHPGEVLTEEFLKPHGLSIDDLATTLGVARQELDGVVNGQRFTAEWLCSCHACLGPACSSG